MGNPGDLGACLGSGAIPWNLPQFPGILPELQMLLPRRCLNRVPHQIGLKCAARAALLRQADERKLIKTERL
jgi:hypothetical protein